MASFVEKATLLVNDKSTTKLAKINRELGKLFKTANKLKKATAFNIKLAGADKAVADVKRVTSAVTSARRAAANPIKITATTTGIANAERRLLALRNRARTPITQLINTRVNGAGVGRGGSIGRVSVDTGALTNTLNNFTSRLAYTIETAIVNGFQRGFKTQDIADTRILLQGLTPQERAQFDASVRRSTAGQTLLSRGQIGQVFSEINPVTRGDVTANEQLFAQIQRVIEMQVSLGVATEDAVDQAFKFAKAAEQSGNITDPKTGNFDLARAQTFFDALLRVGPEIGKEFTGAFVLQAIKYLRASKFTQSPEALQTILLLNEEMGTSASVGYNQLIKQLSGERIMKKQLKNLEALGLITTEQVKSGELEGRTITEIVGGGAKDDALLRTNVMQWFDKNLIPALQAKGVDINDPVAIAKEMGKITSDRTATDIANAIAIRMQEIQKTIDRISGRDVGPDTQEALRGQSGILAFEGAANQLTGLAGEIATAFESYLIPAMNGVASLAQSFSQFIAGEGDGSSATRATAVGVGLAGAGLAGLKGGQLLLRALNPLNGSAVALNGSAAALTRAAAVLAASGGGGIVPGVDGKPGKTGGRVGWGRAAAGVAAATSTLAGIVIALSSFKEPPDQATLEKGRRQGSVRNAIEELAAAKELLAIRETELAENKKQKTGGLFAPIGSLDGVAEKNLFEAEQRVMQALAELANREVDMRANVSRNPFDEQTHESRMQGLAQTLSAPLLETSSRFDTVFQTGSSALQAVGPVIDLAAAQFGPVAGAGILAIAAQFGETVAARIAAAAANVRIDATVTKQPDTGRLAPH